MNGQPPMGKRERIFRNDFLHRENAYLLSRKIKNIAFIKSSHCLLPIALQHSFNPRGTFTANPPSAVSLYLKFMSFAVSHIVLITPSRETRA